MCWLSYYVLLSTFTDNQKNPMRRQLFPVGLDLFFPNELEIIMLSVRRAYSRHCTVCSQFPKTSKHRIRQIP